MAKAKNARKKVVRKSFKKKAAKKKSIRSFRGKSLRRPVRSATRRRWSSTPTTFTCGEIGKTTGTPCDRAVENAGQKCWQHRAKTA
jgi:hypothetical protein